MQLIAIFIAVIAAGLAVCHFLERPTLASGFAAAGAVVRLYGSLS